MSYTITVTENHDIAEEIEEQSLYGDIFTAIDELDFGHTIEVALTTKEMWKMRSEIYKRDMFLSPEYDLRSEIKRIDSKNSVLRLWKLELRKPFISWRRGVLRDRIRDLAEQLHECQERLEES